MFKRIMLIVVLASTLLAQTPVDRFRMNQVQVLGSHNSYKVAIEPSLFQMLRGMDARFDSLEYWHAGFAEQLNLGLRSLEIDVVYDPKGGMYAHPLGLTWTQNPAPYDSAEMMKPGFKVLHVPDVDFRSHAYTFRDALRQLRVWSDAHPNHLPIAVTMNAKDGKPEVPNGVTPLPFDAAAYDAWDAEIREILPPNKLLTPDDVRGRHATLEEAIRSHEWPTLQRARGRFYFILDEGGEKMETYIKGHPSLKGRVMFVNAVEGRPEAAFRIVNEPVTSFHHIQQLVKQGYIVRTRADADTVEARKGDYTRMQAAFDSGAQVISTDYYYPNPAFGTDYKVKLPGDAPGRWDPLLAPPLKNLPSPENAS